MNNETPRDDYDDRPRSRRRDDDYDDRRRRRRDEYDDDDDFDDRPHRRRRHDPMDDPAMRMIMPVGVVPMAIISGYLGLVSILLLPAPFALLTGILAVRQIKRDRKAHGMGRATFGIVMGAIFSVALVIAAVAIIAAESKK